jgi:hypothetical protein
METSAFKLAIIVIVSGWLILLVIRVLYLLACC